MTHVRGGVDAYAAAHKLSRRARARSSGAHASTSACVAARAAVGVGRERIDARAATRECSGRADRYARAERAHRASHARSSARAAIRRIGAEVRAACRAERRARRALTDPRDAGRAADTGHRACAAMRVAAVKIHARSAAIGEAGRARCSHAGSRGAHLAGRADRAARAAMVRIE